MKIVFLGTNGWYDSETGNTLSVLLETKAAYIVFDAGNGIHKLDRFIKSRKPIFLFISHFHFDHLSGLHTFAKFNFKQGIKIYGPKGTRDYLGRLLAEPYTVPANKLKTKVLLNEFKPSGLPFKIEAKKLLHAGICLGYRVCAENKIVTFCTDTGDCPNLRELAKGADLLVTESSLPFGKSNKNWPHLNPGTAALIAKSSNVKKLILTHFDPSYYPDMSTRVDAVKKAKKLFKNTIAAKDGFELNL